jgi:glutamate synthase domain-containing protein 3
LLGEDLTAICSDGVDGIVVGIVALASRKQGGLVVRGGVVARCALRNDEGEQYLKGGTL